MVDDHGIERGQKWLETLLGHMGQFAQVSTIDSPVAEESGTWLLVEEETFSPEHMQIILADKASVLDAIQYLTNIVSNLGLPEPEQIAYTVELAGYRQQRHSELEALAMDAVQQVRSTGKECELLSLSSAERRQVHTILKSYEDLQTESRGREPDRRLVVRMAESSVQESSEP
jgi:spoIIIJ-associated protein